MDGLRLDRLPTEILWRIASLGDPKSALSTTRVCRRLHDALFDTFVFKHIVVSESCLPLDLLEVRVGNDTQAWAKLAIAGWKATRHFSAATGEKDVPLLTQERAALALYVPAMVALNHSIIDSPHVVERLLSPLWDKLPSPKVQTSRGRRASTYDDALISTLADLLNASDPGLAFTLCASTLTNPRALLQCHEGRAATHIMSACANRVENTEYQFRDNHGGVFSPGLGNLALSSWAALLHSHIDMDRGDVRMPIPSKIPWLATGSEERIPFPFTAEASDDEDGADSSFVAWEDWYEARIAHMSGKEWLMDGDWCGYWSFDNYSHDSLSVEFAEPIYRMVLQVSTLRRSSRQGHSSLRIRATYPNNLSNFTLEGSMSSDGMFELGPPGDFWVWRGRMTPFGLFGFWGSADWTRIAGACWLWKTDWCGPVPTSTSSADGAGAG